MPTYVELDFLYHGHITMTHSKSSLSITLRRGVKLILLLAWILVDGMAAQTHVLQAETKGRGYLILTGYLDTASQVATVPIAFLQEQPNDAAATAGPCVAELFDDRTRLLASAYFTPGLTLLAQEPIGQTQSDAPTASAPQPSAANLQEFSVSVPWHAATQRLQIRCAGKRVYTLRRNSRPPAVRLDDPSGSQPAVHGSTVLTWYVMPGGAPVLGTQVQFSSDHGQHWVPLTPFTPGASLSNTLQIDTTLLPSGQGHGLRVLVSDGLNTVYATRTLTIANPLKVATTTPMADATDVSPFAPIEVQFVSPLPSAITAPRNIALTVLDSQGRRITGTLTYLTATQILRFKPNSPLQSGQRYQVQLAPTLHDAAGNLLANPVEWTFTTAKASN